MSDYMKLGGPMPQSIGRCADLYHDVRDLRLAMEKEVEEVRKRESEVREYIIENLSKSADTGAAGLHYRAQIVVKEKRNIADWGVLTSWIRKHDAFGLLQKRLSDTAVKELVEAEGREIPGTEKILVPEVSITKI